MMKRVAVVLSTLLVLMVFLGDADSKRRSSSRSSVAKPSASQTFKPAAPAKSYGTVGSKAKKSDCDAGDLLEGDVADCGAAALPGAVAGAAGATAAGTAVAANATQQVVRRRGPNLMVVLLVGLMLVVVVLALRRARS